MKKLLFTALFAIIGVAAFSQERIAVFPFEIMNNVLTHEEAVMFYQDFSNVFTNRSRNIAVVPRQDVERLINTEMDFQLSAFSAREKTAEMNLVLNGTQILSGRIGRVDNNIRVIVSLYTYPALNQLPGGATLSVANKTELFNRIPELVQSMQNEIAGGGGSGNNNIDPVRALLESGISYYDIGDYDNAILELTRVIRSNPNIAEAFNYRGLAYLSKWDNGRLVEAARADLTNAIRLDPYNAVYYFNRAEAYRLNSSSSTYMSSEQILEELSQAIRLDPHEAIFYVRRGYIYYESRLYDRAIEDLTRAITLNPRIIQAYHWRAWAYESKNDYHMAKYDYDQIINIAPHNGEAYYSRARCWENLGNRSQADSDYAMAESLGYSPR